MSKIAISEITSDWLAANIKGKDLLAAVAVLMGSKRRSKKSASGDSDKPKREVSEGLAAHHQHTAAIAGLVRKFKEEVEAGDREFEMESLPKSAHLRVTSYLKQEGTIDDVIEGEDVGAIEAAINFLVENPEWKPAKKVAAKKATTTTTQPKKAAASKETKVAAKAATKSKKAPAPVLDLSSDSEGEAPVVEAPKKTKATKAATKPAAKPKAKQVLSDSESESEQEAPVVKKSTKASTDASNLTTIDYEGTDYFYDGATGHLYEITGDKKKGKHVGDFNGVTATFH